VFSLNTKEASKTMEKLLNLATVPVFIIAAITAFMGLLNGDIKMVVMSAICISGSLINSAVLMGITSVILGAGTICSHAHIIVIIVCALLTIAFATKTILKINVYRKNRERAKEIAKLS
jgi:uncharacterized membrane protein